MKPKVYAHASYIGNTGYNHHTRDFFRRLSKLIDIKVRNFTVGKSWNGYSNDEPHNGETYIDNIDKKILFEQTLWTSDNNREDFLLYEKYPNNFQHNVNLVLEETNQHYYYDDYKGPKIAYNVWESTLQPEGFFEKLKDFDEIWVPSQWQADCTIAQGMPSNKVKVVPEGVDVDTFYPEDPQTTLDYVDGRFKFVVFGRWDYRKSTKEIIETFLKEFKPEEPVDLIVSIDNPFSGDGLDTTEARLAHYGLVDERIKVKHFPSREDYIAYMKNGHVFVSCARSEGWNLPLIEAMACGTPAIYSTCSGQMEFAKGKGLPVKVIGEKPALDADYNHFNTVVGNYYEPDFEDLARVMRSSFTNYTDHKKRAIEEAKIIHRDFNWDKIASIGEKTLNDFMENYYSSNDSNEIISNFINGPKIEINGDQDKHYFVEFIDSSTNTTHHSQFIKNNMWVKCNKEYYIPWLIKINGKEFTRLDLNDKKVLISLESKSIGDTIGWAPYAVEFAKKHNCKVALSTFHNDWFKQIPEYKDIIFKEPGAIVNNVYVHYKIGWFRDSKGNWQNYDKHPRQCNTIRMQETATDILGLEFKELNYGIDLPKKERPYKQKYIVIGPNATAGCKEWRYEYWVTLSKLLTQSGYLVISLTQNEYKIPGVINHYGYPFDVVANLLHHADLFIGLGSGLSWLNWAIGKHTIMINGFSEKNHEFSSKVTRIMNDNVCFPCWTNRNFTFDAGDWDWCPIHKGTEKQHICQKSILPQQVFNTAKKFLKK